MDFIVRNDLLLFAVAGLCNMSTVSGTFVAAWGIRVIEGLQNSTFGFLLDNNVGWLLRRAFALF
jgi:hypothetical protein